MNVSALPTVVAPYVSVEIPVSSSPAYDVVVAGGGVSGSIAAIAAARAGVRTLLVEEQGFLGGSLTAMGVGPMMSFHNGAGRQVVGGLADEVITRLRRRGASPGHVADTTTYCSTVTPFDSEELKIELETMLQEAGGAVLYHTQLAAVQVQAKQIRSVVVCNKAGLTEIGARIFIDSTGDADLASRAGVPFQLGRESDGATQPMTMNLKVGNVDTGAIRAYALRHPDDFRWEHGAELGLQRLERSRHLSLAGFLRAWAAAQVAKEIDIPRDHVLFFETATPGVVIVNTSRVQGLDATDPIQLSRAEMIGRQQCAQLFAFLRKNCAGFAHAIRMDAAPKIGVRETRRIAGLYLLTVEDLLGPQLYPDTIAMGGYPIDIHSPNDQSVSTRRLPSGHSYAIPLRCLLANEPHNLIVVGRAVSATHEAAAAIRVSPIAMAIGHAGGVLAAEAVASQCAPAQVAAAAVQAKLTVQGAVLCGP